MLFFDVQVPKAAVTVEDCKIFRAKKSGCSLIKPRQGVRIELGYSVQRAEVYTKSEFWLFILSLLGDYNSGKRPGRVTFSDAFSALVAPFSLSARTVIYTGAVIYAAHLPRLLDVQWLWFPQSH